MNSKKKTGLLLAGLLVLAAIAGAVLIGKYSGTPDARPTATATAVVSASATPSSRLATISAAELPAEARDTLALIDQGGPFPYRQDGVVFENRENRLPKRAGGYYHEYTVKTPGERDRGPRRIVVGSDGDTYYTADHYASFRHVLR
ncbi:ribonuclease domain-containing protein [Longispora albida]|uniref:ribonuclease domain-containing protein n=1 Tax=Longispora albida TaxID=203523 RepID=UPI000369DED4|nr:ribonuclease domain-containing protein [Longispora albida]